MTPSPKTTTIRDQVSDAEWQARVDLAAAYRLAALYGWDDLIFTHISARVPGGDHHFLLNPYGMMFDEVTASSLVKIDLQGNKVGDSPYFINPAGFTIHSAVHEARADALCLSAPARSKYSLSPAAANFPRFRKRSSAASLHKWTR